MKEWNKALEYSKVNDNSVLLWLDSMGDIHYGDTPTLQAGVKTILAVFDNGRDTFGQHKCEDGIIERI